MRYEILNYLGQWTRSICDDFIEIIELDCKWRL
jgi:hypothetical protein